MQVVLHMSGAAMRTCKQQQQQSSVLLELPAHFDAAGDSGAIGRIQCCWAGGSSSRLTARPAPQQQVAHRAGTELTRRNGSYRGSNPKETMTHTVTWSQSRLRTESEYRDGSDARDGAGGYLR